MLFNSLDFIAFFLVVYALYLSLNRSFKAQNILLLAASYFFYGFWNYKLLSLLLISTLIDYCTGLLLHSSKAAHRRKIYLTISMVSNLGILCAFKYFNFFADSFVEMAHWIGWQPSPITLNVILPVGISFYTFQSMSYTIDIYRKETTPTRNLLDFALYVAYFPQLVAGPIERASYLLNQIQSKRNITAADIDSGLILILWGFFKKVVIADNLAAVVNPIFGKYTQFEGLDFVLATLAFGIQIYGDFSGYSDIARGTSRLMGIDLRMNFRIPYMAKNPRDFWMRWHISLSSWFRDYLYIPLGGNKGGTWLNYRNLMITMLIAGLWHGARWNYVIWGGYHGILLILHRVFEKWARDKNWAMAQAAWTGPIKQLAMFVLVSIGWIFFRCDSLQQIGYIFSHISLVPHTLGFKHAFLLLAFISPLLLVEAIQQKTRDFFFLNRFPGAIRAGVYVSLLVAIFLLGERQTVEFIYFQF